jgi:hypothetical protein
MPGRGFAAWLLATALCVWLGSAIGQTPAALPTPVLDLRANGTVYAVALQPDGGVVIGGEFSAINGEPRRNIARLRPDGSLDPDWTCPIGGRVHALAVSDVGEVFVAGNFFVVDGKSRVGLAKLSAAGVVDDLWQPMPNNGDIHALALDDEGALFIAGTFQSVNGVPRERLAKVASAGAGALDAQWNPASNDHVSRLVAEGDDALFVAGLFTSIGGEDRYRVAKLRRSGTGEADPLWDAQPNWSVDDVVADGAGSVFLAGGFSSVGGQPRQGIAKLASSDAAVDPNWNPGVTGAYYGGLAFADGFLYSVGLFSQSGDVDRNRVVKLEGTGTGQLDPNWHPSFEGPVHRIHAAPSGKTFVSGDFGRVDGELRLGFVALDAAGVPASALDVEKPGAVFALARHIDGGVIVGGEFRRAGNVERNNLLRLDANGQIDPLWNPDADRRVGALAVDAEGEVFAAGWFRRIGAQARRGLAKLDAGDGAADPLWAPESYGVVEALALDGLGSVYVGGYFFGIGDASEVSHLAKLSTTGTAQVDQRWNPSPNDWVLALALDDGGLYVGGGFTQVGGLAGYNNLVKLRRDEVGSVVVGWSPSPSAPVTKLGLDGAGSLYLSGVFRDIAAVPRNGLARVSAETGLVDGWNPPAIHQVSALAFDGSHAVYVGGMFNWIGEGPRRNVAKLSTAEAGGVDPGWRPEITGESWTQVEQLLLKGDGTLLAAGQFTHVNGERRVGIVALPLTYTLSYSSDSHGALSGSALQILEFQQSGLPVTAVADDGYHFVGWSDGKLENPRTDASVTADLSAHALFRSDFHTLTYQAYVTAGSIEGPNPQTIADGNEGAPVTAVPRPGYEFVRWSDGRTDNPRVDTSVIASRSVQAYFRLLPPEVFDDGFE